MTARPLLLLALLPIAGAAAGQTVGPPAPAPIVKQPDCDPEAAEDNEIVVCGDRYDENSPFRVPKQFRNQRSDEDRHASWTARIQDEESLSQFGSQTVGPSGYLQNSRQRDCEWRAARQEMRGERPDCGKGQKF